MIEQITNLLRFVATLRRQFEKITEATGENFNIFRVLNLSTHETRTHSAFLGELLSPKGTHGQGSIFLKHFLTYLKIDNFDHDKALVEIEKFAGYVDKDYLEGGRIDIVISDKKGRGIIIENKIYAGDQKNQLLRYDKYGKSNFPEGFNLLYLTLNGIEPSESSLGSNTKINFRIISYKYDVLTWLESSRKEAVQYPLLRETITQYIYLIKFLTGTSMNSDMQGQIINLLTQSDDNIEATFVIAESFQKVRNGLMQKLAQKISIEISDYNPVFDQEFGKRKTGLKIKSENWRYCAIRFEFGGDYSGLYFGIIYNDPLSVPKDLTEKFTRRIQESGLSELGWPWWRYLIEGTLDSKFFIEIKNDKISLPKVIKEKVVMLYNIIEQIENEIDQIRPE